MPILIRKQVLLSLHNLTKLRQWAHDYDLSQSELVRRALESYDPERRQALIFQAEEEAIEACLDHIEGAMRSARRAVETTNERVAQVISSLNDANARATFVLEVRQEVNENPGFLDEVTKFIAGKEDNSGKRR